ncbi:ef-hand calcium-binding domain protein [Diplodia corticola]|uniref:Ef-hand calcium-binding domain protein n=1 Tax=Diplodia corticola TaxID=236234 RepID=A0A1J9QUM4_9PEZI|nr:ef-hand calcium-binding domain protein [Diplodia corticola]OJD32105.1 ef-hand calcium-binding domain protein [Diplodia corticola]
MRFLCLHGHGTNSQILEAQLEPLRSRLPRDWEYEFLDGEKETIPATGIDAVFPGPYVCYHEEPIPEDVQHAVDLVKEVIREEGPFDGVIGFSQGAALAATVIAAEAERDPLAETFKVAIFLSATMPFDFSAGKLRLTCEADNTLTATHQDIDGTKLDGGKQDWLNDCRTAGVIAEFQARRPQVEKSALPQSVDVLLRYHPSTHPQQIDIPTVHVIGLKDEYLDHGKNLAGICNSRIQQVVTHDGGHQLPREGATVSRVAEAIQWAVDRMLFHN